MKNAILAIDDETHVLSALKRTLRRDGHEIMVAESGSEAMDLLAENDIAVIICDQRMPGMSGAEVLAESVKVSPDTFRITLTGYTDLKAAQSSINEGRVNQFLTKPWDEKQLRQIVKQGIQSYELISENRRLEALTRKQNEQLSQWNEQLEEQVKERTEQLEVRNKLLLRMSQRLEGSLRDTVAVLASMLEAVCPALGLHSKRVGQVARKVGEALNLEKRALRDLEFAAHLHDIGKIVSMTADTTSKRSSGSSKTKERTNVPEAGHAILSQVNGFGDVAHAIRHQSARFDGAGSSPSMQGRNIPLASRVIAVVDVYDQALYGSSTPTDLSFQEAQRKLKAGAGKALDPGVVAMLLKTIIPEAQASFRDAELELSPRQLKAGMILSKDFNNADGVLLLKAGVELTDETIDRIRALNGGGMLLTGVRVRGKVADEHADGTE